MNIAGRVHNGVIIPDGDLRLPEGSIVSISYVAPEPADYAATSKVRFPLVVTGLPGSVNLTNERIAEILNEEGAHPMHEASPNDWRSTIGMFAGDPIMREIIDEARKIRECDRELTRD